MDLIKLWPMKSSDLFFWCSAGLTEGGKSLFILEIVCLPANGCTVKKHKRVKRDLTRVRTVQWCFWCPDMQYLYTPGSVTDTGILCGCGVNSNYSLSACSSLFAVALQWVGSVQEVWSKNGHRVKYLHNLHDAGNNLGGLELWERWSLERQEINYGLYQPRWFCIIKLFFNNRWWHFYDSYDDEEDDDKITDKSKDLRKKT